MMMLYHFKVAYSHKRNRGEANEPHTAQGDEKKLSTAGRTFRSVDIKFME